MYLIYWPWATCCFFGSMKSNNRSHVSFIFPQWSMKSGKAVNWGFWAVISMYAFNVDVPSGLGRSGNIVSALCWRLQKWLWAASQATWSVSVFLRHHCTMWTAWPLLWAVSLWHPWFVLYGFAKEKSQASELKIDQAVSQNQEVHMTLLPLPRRSAPEKGRE